MADNPPPPRSPIRDRAALAKKAVQAKIEKVTKGSLEALDKRHDLIAGFRTNRNRADVERAVKAFLTRTHQEESDADVKARVDWLFEVLQSGDEVSKTGVQSFIKMMVEEQQQQTTLFSSGAAVAAESFDSSSAESFDSSAEESSFAVSAAAAPMVALTAAPRDAAAASTESSWFVNDYGEIRSTKKYCSLDVGWGTCMIQMMANWKSSLKHLFKDTPATVAVTKPNIRLALVGDWGTGPKSDFPTSAFNNVKRVLAQRCVSQSLYYTIHLGDVYYAGTPEEEQNNFISHWPVPKPTGRSFALNSNHEMYNKHGFFETALGDIKFASQQGTSYFALVINNKWLVFGLDSAWDANGSTYMDGNLTSTQKTFITKTRQDNPSITKFIILTHHDPINLDGSKLHPMYNQVKETLGAEPTYWYYGHVHNGIVYKPGTAGVSTLFRCSGHGAFPYGYTKKLEVQSVDWFENILTDSGARCRNGYVEVELDDESLVETWICELGQERVVYRDGVRQGGDATSTSSSSTST